MIIVSDATIITKTDDLDIDVRSIKSIEYIKLTNNLKRGSFVELGFSDQSSWSFDTSGKRSPTVSSINGVEPLNNNDLLNKLKSII